MEQQRERIVIRKTKPTFSKEQKASFWLVTITGFFSLVLGGFYLSRHIVKPFFIEYTGEFYFTEEQEQSIEMLEQQTKDSDGDTLTDYDELYVYGSSPYLADTDGDGYDDATEVEAGTDIDCAAGETCYDGEYVADTEILTDVVEQNTAIAEDTNTSISDLQGILTTMTADDIRDLVISAGADPDVVAGLSDDELVMLMQDLLVDTGDVEVVEEVVETTTQDGTETQ